MYTNTFRKFLDTPTNENQDLYSSARKNELSTLINKKVLSETSENKIRTDMLVSTSSGFKDPEIPSKFNMKMK